MNPMLLFGLLLLIVLAYFIWKEFKPRFKPLFSRKRSEKEVKKMLKEKLFIPKEMTGTRKKAPIAGKCYKCRKKTTMPYKCKFCGGLYCDKHRLPESHSCEGLKRLKREKNK